MRLTTPTVPLLSTVVAAALAAAPCQVAFAAPADGKTKPSASKKKPDTKESSAEEPDDAGDEEKPEGESADSEGSTDETQPAEGEEKAGEGEEAGEGETAEGEETGEGETAGEGETSGDEEAAEAAEAKGESHEAAEAGAGTPEPPAPEVAVPNPEDERPLEPRVAGHARNGKGLLIAGGSVLGAGIVLTSVFAGITRGCSLHGPLECKYRTQDNLLIPMGAAVTLLGIVMLSVGASYYVSYKKWEAWKPGQNDDKKKKKSRRGRRRASAFVMPTMFRGGAGLGAVGRF